MKKYIYGVVLIALAISISACGTDAAQVSEPQVTALKDEEIAQAEPVEIVLEDQESEYLAVTNGLLSEADVLGLVYMREEEKLAHDVYTVLFEKWGLPIFQNIASSELTHTQAIRSLLENYDIPDPVVENLVGQFTNQDLQALYDQLIAMGSVSLNDAIIVGASIEEIDILDLKERIGQTEVFDITQVYENLLSGSKNHLQAFAAMFEKQTGQSYQPSYMSINAYEEIIAGGSQTGQGNGLMAGKGARR